MSLSTSRSGGDVGHLSDHNLLHTRYNNSVEILSDVIGSRPAAGAVDVGTLFVATDEAKVYRSDGASTWTELAAAASTPDYTAVSGADAATDVSGAELEELTDGSQTTLHTHADQGTTDDYSDISANDAATNVTGAELEALTDGSETALHSHAVDHGGLTGLADDDHSAYPLADNTRFPEPLYINRSGRDSEGVWATIEWFRADDDTKAMKSVLSGGTSPKYTTRTVTEYAANGTTVVRTTAYTLSYDTNDELEDETPTP